MLESYSGQREQNFTPDWNTISTSRMEAYFHSIATKAVCLRERTVMLA